MRRIASSVAAHLLCGKLTLKHGKMDTLIHMAISVILLLCYEDRAWLVGGLIICSKTTRSHTGLPLKNMP